MHITINYYRSVSVNSTAVQYGTLQDSSGSRMYKTIMGSA